MIKRNPFVSHLFTNVWGKNFNHKNTVFNFNFITQISFYKPLFLPLFINIGKNLTKGISYSINENSKNLNFKGKVLLIYDVPRYFNLKEGHLPKGIKSIRIKQYPGFLISLENYKDLNDYLSKSFSKSSKQKFNRYKSRLELCFDIKEKMLIGNIEKSEYDFVFNHFKALLTKRFDDKQIVNNNLNPEEWNFYYEVVYPMLLENKAALYVIYNGNIPICVRLLYFSDTIIFDAITVFDIDYSKFHIGKVSIMKMLEWSFKHNYKIFDFSKGYYDYKESWSSLKYDFEYHVLFDHTSIISYTLGKTIALYFKFKQFLREKELNKKLHKLTYRLRKSNSNDTSLTKEITYDNINLDSSNLKEIKLDDNYPFLKKHAYDFLFITKEHFENLKIYKANTTYILEVNEHRKILSIKL
ncbi:GNAT family N-acetyltransferase [Thalassobellus sediminis]|uniref:GNAT family N-acetyltransferase n=1 Tax=Thalassobellus sediminis TaxID=3367753 RepID=UPI0037B004A2